MYTYIYVYIYIYLFPPWINKGIPPYLFSPSKRPFSLFIYYKKGQKYTNPGQDFINTFLRHGRYQLCHFGGHLGDDLEGIKTRPLKKRSVVYVKY